MRSDQGGSRGTGTDPRLAPIDRVGLQRALIRVAQAARQNGRAIESLAQQLVLLDRRLQALEELARSPTRPEMQQLGHEVAVAAERTVVLDDRLTRLEQLRHEVVFGSRRTGDLENRITAMERRRDEPASPAGPAETPKGRPTTREQRGGAGPAAADGTGAVDERFAALDARLSSLEERDRDVAAATDESLGALVERLTLLESLSADMEQRVDERFRQAAEAPLRPPGAAEGIHKDLDAMAERVAARDATVAAQLERVTNLDRSVRRLREELRQVIDGRAEVHEQASPPAEEAVEESLEALESPGAEVERLCRSLRRLTGEPPEEGPDAADEPRRGQAGVVEALSAELHRIRRSLESPPLDGTGG